MATTPDPPPNQSHLLDAERDVKSRLGDQALDFASLDAISNIYRAAASVRKQAERQILAPHNLSFGGFTILFVLWIWDDMETSQLAEECNLAKGTLSGMLNTLEKQGQIERVRMTNDKRRVMVSLTELGTTTISEVFPEFNAFESQMASGLSEAEKTELARLLRIVTTNASG